MIWRPVNQLDNLVRQALPKRWIEESLPYYERAAQQYNVEPVTFLNYGKALMQTGDYVGATHRQAECVATIGAGDMATCR